jgi:hypothetical protein
MTPQWFAEERNPANSRGQTDARLSLESTEAAATAPAAAIVPEGAGTAPLAPPAYQTPVIRVPSTMDRELARIPAAA